MDRDRRLTGYLRGQTDNPSAPAGFELNNPWRVSWKTIYFVDCSLIPCFAARETHPLGCLVDLLLYICLGLGETIKNPNSPIFLPCDLCVRRIEYISLLRFSYPLENVFGSIPPFSLIGGK
jgi:hypothetical protein